jgi:hypothetical protein
VSTPDSGECDRRAELVFVPAARSLRLGTVEREGRVDCSAAEERTSAEGMNGFFWNEETIVRGEKMDITKLLELGMDSKILERPQ